MMYRPSSIQVPYDLWETFEELAIAAEALLVKLAWSPDNQKAEEEYLEVYAILQRLHRDDRLSIPASGGGGENPPSVKKPKARKFFGKKGGRHGR